MFRDIYVANFEFVWRSLRRLGVGEADVPDALQEVFLVVHRRLDEFEGRARLTTWLFRICLNVARARQRMGRRRKEVFDSNLADRWAGDARDPADVAIHHEGLALLERALSEMSIDQRAVFALFELEQMTCQQIADLLEIPLGTVYSRLRLGRESFQRSVRRISKDAAPIVQGGGR
jgi:RNA polymerase sigma-70 factor, ECF subfamily